MTDLHTAARMALEALEHADDWMARVDGNDRGGHEWLNAAITALRAALEAPTPAVTGHIYQGNCPDEVNPDARDPECPACRALEAQQEPDCLKGWKLNHAQADENDVWWVGYLDDEDDRFSPVIQVDTANYGFFEHSEPIARYLLAMLAARPQPKETT